MRFVDLVEQGDAVGFEKLLEQRMSQKVGAILREAQAFIAQKMFAEHTHAADESDCGGCGEPDCVNCQGEEMQEGPFPTSNPEAVEDPAAAPSHDVH